MRLLRTALVSVVAASFAACTPPSLSSNPEAAQHPLTFSYAPPTTSAPNSAKVTLAVVQPQWARTEGAADLNQLTTAMGNDFMALLNARGFTTRGPFDSYQAMVFPDKTGSDLVLTPEMQLSWQFADVKTAQANDGLMAALLNPGKTSYVVNGTVTISGAINLLLSESMTNERMWSKSIKVDPIVVAWAGSKHYDPTTDPSLSAPGALRNFLMSDPGFQQAVFPKLEAMYQSIMQKSWDYLDPREVQLVKSQAAELKRRAGGQ